MKVWIFLSNSGPTSKWGSAVWPFHIKTLKKYAASVYYTVQLFWPGFVPIPYSAAYGASKAAETQFFSTQHMEMSAREDRSYSISICLLGSIDTERPKAWKRR